MIADRWEHGSDLPWIEPTSGGRYPWSSAVFYGCGRFALNAAVEGVRRLWVPAFFCQEVLEAIANVELVTYADAPGALAEDLSALPFQSGDAVFAVNTLGLRAQPPRVPAGIPVIEDHTHDLWSAWAFASTAPIAIASLRKLLPVPDGGVLWSPAGNGLPAEPPLDGAHARAALDRLEGMVLKTAYLAGAAIPKDAFRAHALAGEAAIAEGPSSAPLPLTRTILGAFPVDDWRARRAANHAAFAAALGSASGVQVLAPQPGATPYTVTLVFETPALRERARMALIQARIYPAILWSLEHPAVSIAPDMLDLSRRILSLHCDLRYTASDMERVAAAVRAALV